MDRDSESDGVTSVPDVHEEDPEETLLRKLTLHKEGAFIVDNATGRRLGEEKFISANELVLKCKCLTHDDCTLVMSATRSTLGKLLSSYSWLSTGRDPAVTREKHQEEAVALKQRFGIRPRPPGPR